MRCFRCACCWQYFQLVTSVCSSSDELSSTCSLKFDVVNDSSALISTPRVKYHCQLIVCMMRDVM